tara:strand:- start:78 stop:359 length:282 start_codon:yes stop_codon:yes gene_type:complete
MTDQNSINDTLNVIRKALEEDIFETETKNSDVLILDKLVRDDGTIHHLKNDSLDKNEIKEILNDNITKYFDKNLNEWLEKNMPHHVEKYLNKK